MVWIQQQYKHQHSNYDDSMPEAAVYYGGSFWRSFSGNGSEGNCILHKLLGIFIRANIQKRKTSAGRFSKIKFVFKWCLTEIFLKLKPCNLYVIFEKDSRFFCQALQKILIVISMYKIHSTNLNTVLLFSSI